MPADFIRSVNATNPDDNAWARLERGMLSLDEFDRAFAAESKALGAEVPGREVLGLLGGDLRPTMVEAVRRCGEHYLTAVLTNNFLPVADAEGGGSAPFAAVLDHVDLVLESSQIGVRKPDPVFYELACDRLDIEARIAIAHGRDAADVAIYNQYGPLLLPEDMRVIVERRDSP